MSGMSGEFARVDCIREFFFPGSFVFRGSVGGIWIRICGSVGGICFYGDHLFGGIGFVQGSGSVGGIVLSSDLPTR